MSVTGSIPDLNLGRKKRKRERKRDGLGGEPVSSRSVIEPAGPPKNPRALLHCAALDCTALGLLLLNLPPARLPACSTDPPPAKLLLLLLLHQRDNQRDTPAFHASLACPARSLQTAAAPLSCPSTLRLFACCRPSFYPHTLSSFHPPPSSLQHILSSKAQLSSPAGFLAQSPRPPPNIQLSLFSAVLQRRLTGPTSALPSHHVFSSSFHQ